MKIQTRIVAILVAVTFSGMCFAPIEDKPEGSTFHPELSQSQMEKLQGTGVVDSGGPASNPSDLNNQGPTQPQEQADASKMLSSSATGGAVQAEQSLKTAEKDQKSPTQSSGMNMMLAGLLILIGLASAFGIRAYMDKTIPDNSVKKK
ncbi:MAG: hypothetical protein ACKVQS_10865 [Fimbriimonadaceae bacterium]